MLIVLSVLSVALGNIVAIAQTNLKRMLAYSTIANMGYMLLGFLAADVNGYSAAMFYMVSYVLTSLASFGMILLLSRKGFEADSLEDFKGLNRARRGGRSSCCWSCSRSPGMPPTVGFYAKLAVLQAAVKAGFVWLAVVGVRRRADRRVLLPAHRQAHVLRRAGRPLADRGARRHRACCCPPTDSRCCCSASCRSR